MSARSTITGWTPWPGALAEVQMYHPTRPSPDASLADRIAAGVRYGEPELMRLKSARTDEDGRTRWYLVAVATGRDSWVDDDFAVLTDASAQEAQPDLLALLGTTPGTGS